MNTPPRSQIPINTPPYPSEFQQLIREKSKNFVGREFVFTAINEFLHKYAHGYFTLIGAPGSGKSAILAKYVTSNPHVVYYNAQVEGKNRADQFLTDICTQLINQYPHVGTEYVVSLPDNATEGSWFLSLLLQEISDSLEPNQPLIIAIDALDAIAPNSQSASSNLFYLPRYLPQKTYFLLTRRPFVRERSGLLIEAPSQALTLEDYPQQNQEDVQAYIQQCLTPLTPLAKGGTGEEHSLTKAETGIEESLTKAETGIEESLAKGGTGEELRDRISPPLKRGVGGDLEELGERLIQQLTAQSENNFMYLSQILPAIAQGFYSQPYQCDRFPPGLEAYYQSHWQRMKGEELSSVELGVLRTLVTPQNSLDSPLSPLQTAGISVDAVSEAMPAGLIAQIIDEDEYDVEAVLSNWIEFLRRQPIDGEIYYSFYHSSFHYWLERQSSQRS